MQRVDRAVSVVIALIGLIWFLAIGILQNVARSVVSPLMAGPQTSETTGIFLWRTSTPTIPLWLNTLIILPPLIVLASAVGVYQGKVWGFQLAVITFGLMAFSGNLAFASLAVVLYAVLRLLDRV